MKKRAITAMVIAEKLLKRICRCPLSFLSK
jgi:hypothetical protein